MENKAAPQELITRGMRAAAIATFVALLASLSIMAGGAAAKRHTLVGRDGKIHACYRVKGKPKGMVRVVRSRSHHCRRGERRLAWSVTGDASQAGQAGANGQDGQATAGGTTTTSKETALETKVAGLTLQVEQLESLVKGLAGEVNGVEGLLNGVEPGDLGGVLNRVNGLEGTLEGVDNEGLTHAVSAVKDVTGAKLLEAVNAVPLVDEVCAQTEALTGVTNEFGTEFQKLLTTLSGSLLGAIFGGVEVPGTVDETLSCPS
jgi:hypothetical protein